MYALCPQMHGMYALMYAMYALMYAMYAEMRTLRVRYVYVTVLYAVRAFPMYALGRPYL
jgi:hypothetical protein